MNQDSLVGIVTRLWAGQSRNRYSICSRERDFFFHHNVQTCSGSHAAAYTMGAGSGFPAVS
jgi:hypothetical protein